MMPGHPVAANKDAELTANCPMARLLEMLTRPWTLHILWVLGGHGPMRFGALRRAVEGISARLLTVRLRTLEQEGFVTRSVVPGKVPEVTYTPTDQMRDIGEFMQQLQRASERWHTPEGSPRREVTRTVPGERLLC